MQRRVGSPWAGPTTANKRDVPHAKEYKLRGVYFPYSSCLPVACMVPLRIVFVVVLDQCRLRPGENDDDTASGLPDFTD
jgi:hypothetical protein